MIRNIPDRIEFNIKFAKILKKLGYSLLAEEIENRQTSVYEDWYKCNKKSTFFSRLGNGYCIRYYEKRVLDDLFNRGQRAVLSYADKRADQIKSEVQKRRGIKGGVERFEPRIKGILSPRDNYRCMKDY